jgi:branched-chain amino acid transport system substrate-binding protein
VSKSRPYHETGHPEVARFRAAMKRYYGSREAKMHQWALEGWGAAMWLTDAIASCGARLTRVCVEKYMNEPTRRYTARGLFTARDFRVVNFDTEKAKKECTSVVQYQTDHWVTRGPMDTTCFTTNNRAYDPS